MRLVNVATLKLESFLDHDAPPYAILSHTWAENDSEEISFQDLENGNTDKHGLGSSKLRGCCEQAKKDGYKYIWIDTCCIDKTNSVELGEAINSMYRWYACAAVCYAYLSDVPADENPKADGSKFQTSRWFRRGWTLQELLAPKSLKFYGFDRDARRHPGPRSSALLFLGTNWRPLGTKSSLCATIESITGIPKLILKGVTDIRSASIAQRMSWAAQRETKRKEDLAYSLLGIFGIAMPMIYGEGGERAFLRLQMEIITKTSADHSILAWGLGERFVGDSSPEGAVPVLAVSPAAFADSGRIVSRGSGPSPGSIRIHGGTLEISLPKRSVGQFRVLLDCGPENNDAEVIAIPLASTSRSSGKQSEGHLFRPKDRHAYIWPKSNDPPGATSVVRIQNDIQIRSSTGWGLQYDEDELAALDLALIDVIPVDTWDKEKAVIMSTTGLKNGAQQRVWTRFRHHKHDRSQDFVMVITLTQANAHVYAIEHCLSVCSRETAMKDMEGNLEDLKQKISGKISASNGSLNLTVHCEGVPGLPWLLNITPKSMPLPPEETTNITTELWSLTLCRAMAVSLEKARRCKSVVLVMRNDLGELESNHEAVQSELRAVEKDLGRLELQRASLANADRDILERLDILLHQRARLEEEEQLAAQDYASFWDELRSIKIAAGSRVSDHAEGVTVDFELIRLASKRVMGSENGGNSPPLLGDHQDDKNNEGVATIRAGSGPQNPANSVAETPTTGVPSLRTAGLAPVTRARAHGRATSGSRTTLPETTPSTWTLLKSIVKGKPL